MIKSEFYNSFFKDVASIFGIEKLTKDLLNYIEGFNVSSVHEFTETVKTHKIEKTILLVLVRFIY